MLFKHNPYPEVAKGLVQYYMEPENLRVVIEEGRWALGAAVPRACIESTSGSARRSSIGA